MCIVMGRAISRINIIRMHNLNRGHIRTRAAIMIVSQIINHIRINSRSRNIITHVVLRNHCRYRIRVRITISGRNLIIKPRYISLSMCIVGMRIRINRLSIRIRSRIRVRNTKLVYVIFIMSDLQLRSTS